MISRIAALAPLALAGWLAAQSVLAQGLPIPGFGNTGTALPVAIEADKGVEWRQNEQVYIARGNATAKRGDTSIRADALYAHYRKTADNRQEKRGHRCNTRKHAMDEYWRIGTSSCG